MVLSTFRQASACLLPLDSGTKASVAPDFGWQLRAVPSAIKLTGRDGQGIDGLISWDKPLKQGSASTLRVFMGDGLPSVPAKLAEKIGKGDTLCFTGKAKKVPSPLWDVYECSTQISGLLIRRRQGPRHGEENEHMLSDLRTRIWALKNCEREMFTFEIIFRFIRIKFVQHQPC